MMSSFVKIMFSLIRNVLLSFSGSRRCAYAYSTAHTVNCEKRVYDINTTVYSYFTKKKYFTG